MHVVLQLTMHVSLQLTMHVNWADRARGPPADYAREPLADHAREPSAAPSRRLSWPCPWTELPMHVESADHTRELSYPCTWNQLTIHVNWADHARGPLADHANRPSADHVQYRSGLSWPGTWTELTMHMNGDLQLTSTADHPRKLSWPCTWIFNWPCTLIHLTMHVDLQLTLHLDTVDNARGLNCKGKTFSFGKFNWQNELCERNYLLESATYRNQRRKIWKIQLNYNQIVNDIILLLLFISWAKELQKLKVLYRFLYKRTGGSPMTLLVVWKVNYTKAFYS